MRNDVQIYYVKDWLGCAKILAFLKTLELSLGAISEKMYHYSSLDFNSLPKFTGEFVGVVRVPASTKVLKPAAENLRSFNFVLKVGKGLQGGWGRWPTGNGKKVSYSQACCLAQLCLAAA